MTSLLLCGSFLSLLQVVLAQAGLGSSYCACNITTGAASTTTITSYVLQTSTVLVDLITETVGTFIPVETSLTYKTLVETSTTVPLFTATYTSVITDIETPTIDVTSTTAFTVFQTSSDIVDYPFVASSTSYDFITLTSEPTVTETAATSTLVDYITSPVPTGFNNPTKRSVLEPTYEATLAPWTFTTGGQVCVRSSWVSTIWSSNTSTTSSISTSGSSLLSSPSSAASSSPASISTSSARLTSTFSTKSTTSFTTSAPIISTMTTFGTGTSPSTVTSGSVVEIYLPRYYVTVTSGNVGTTITTGGTIEVVVPTPPLYPTSSNATTFPTSSKCVCSATSVSSVFVTSTSVMYMTITGASNAAYSVVSTLVADEIITSTETTVLISTGTSATVLTVPSTTSTTILETLPVYAADYVTSTIGLTTTTTDIIVNTSTSTTSTSTVTTTSSTTTDVEPSTTTTTPVATSTSTIVPFIPAPPLCGNQGVQRGIWFQSDNPANPVCEPDFTPNCFDQGLAHTTNIANQIGPIETTYDPNSNGLNDYYDGDSGPMGVEFVGYFWAPENGTYYISWDVLDDEIAVWVGDAAFQGNTAANALIVDEVFGAEQMGSGQVDLEQGRFYALRVQYWNRGGQGSLGGFYIEMPDGRALFQEDVNDYLVQYSCDDTASAFPPWTNITTCTGNEPATCFTITAHGYPTVEGLTLDFNSQPQFDTDSAGLYYFFNDTSSGNMYQVQPQNSGRSYEFGVMTYPAGGPDYYFTFLPYTAGEWDYSTCTANADQSLTCNQGGLTDIYVYYGDTNPIFEVGNYQHYDPSYYPLTLTWAAVPCTC